MAINQLKSLLGSNTTKKLTLKGNIPLIEYKGDN